MAWRGDGLARDPGRPGRLVLEGAAPVVTSTLWNMLRPEDWLWGDEEVKRKDGGCGWMMGFWEGEGAKGAEEVFGGGMVICWGAGSASEGREMWDVGS